MNLQEVIEEVRILLNDVQHNINQGYSDTIIQDRTFILAINECISEMESRLGVERISYEDTDFNIPLITGQNLYAIPNNINSIRDLILIRGSVNLFPVQRTFEDIKFEVDFKGIPQFYSLDYKTGFIRFAPTPNDDETVLKFIGRKNSERLTLTDMGREMPFDSRYHNAFIYYLCYYACTNLIDVDNGQQSRGQVYLRNFLNEIQKYKNDILQKTYTPYGITFDNDRYNT